MAIPFDGAPRDRIDVLCVDDDDIFLQLTQTFLERQYDGFVIHTAGRATEALEHLETTPIDCIVSDYEMPGMNGLEFLRMVRETVGDVPFILFTGHGSEKIASEAISAGVTDYLPKEFGRYQYSVLANHVLNAVESNRRRRAHEESKALFEATFTDSSRPLAVLGPDGTVQRANQALYAFLESSSGDPVGDPVWELPWPAAFEAAAPELRPWIRDAAAGRSLSAEFTYRTDADDSDGDDSQSVGVERAFVEMSLEPASVDGDVTSIVVELRNTSTEAASEREIALKNAAMDAAPVGITITDPSRPDNPIIYANEGFEGLTGYPIDEVTGRNCRFLQGDDTDPAARERLRTAIDDAQPVTTVLKNYRKDGTPFWNEVTIAPIRDHDGTVTHFVGFQLDVTHTQELQDRLIRERDQLEEFASVVSHDLRSPLMAASGYLELIGDDYSNPFLESANESLERMEAILDGAVLLARAGNVDLNLEALSLSTVVTRVWERIDSNNGTLEIIDDQQFLADPDQVEKVFELLFRNSLVYSRPTESRDASDISVVVGPLPDGVYVEDDGPGIPPTEHDRVFDPGYSTTDRPGFGLGIVTKIVDGHGWEIDISDSETDGARFEITDLERP